VNGDSSDVDLQVQTESAVDDLANTGASELRTQSEAEGDPLVSDPNVPSEQPGGGARDRGGWVVAFLASAALIGIFKLLKVLIPNCGGLILTDVVPGRKRDWDRKIRESGGPTFRPAPARYPGTDSPAGCGANSVYLVTWSVTKEVQTGAGPFRLRPFLKDLGLTLAPGLRSLDPGSRISLRELVGLSA
jgi:hypothetical protein